MVLDHSMTDPFAILEVALIQNSEILYPVFAALLPKGSVELAEQVVALSEEVAQEVIGEGA